MRKATTVTAVVVAAVLVTASVHAQELRGELVETDNDRPIPGAVVILLDEAGVERASTLTRAGGAFELKAPAPGRYRIRADRVGYRSHTTPVLNLSAGETREYRMSIPTEAVVLEGISVQAERRCLVRPSEGPTAYEIWEEARKALQATTLASERQLFRFTAAVYEREIDPQTLRVIREENRRATALTEAPFAALPVEDLMERGFVQITPDGTEYYALDAKMLLSDAFLDQHCFRPRAGRGGMVGLAFEPIGRRGVPGVDGVLWLDQRTSELRYLEFSYTELPWSVRADSVGGRVEFRRMPSGAWIVEKWWIRMPVIHLQDGEGNALSIGPSAVRREVLAGYKVDGGSILEIAAGPGDPMRASRAAVDGIVWDSASDAPLTGAQVFISGTQYGAVTDEVGRFRLQDLPDGEFSISFMHPRLDSVGVIATPQPISLQAGETVAVELGVPGPLHVAAARSSGPDSPRVLRRDSGAGRFAAIRGQVVDPEGNPVGAAQVMVGGGDDGSLTDEVGAFQVAGLSAGIHSLEVRHIGYAPRTFTVEVDAGDLVELAVALEVAPVRIANVIARGRRDATGFDARRQRSTGHFITREDIDEQRPARFTDLLRSVPGVRLISTGGGERVEMTGRDPQRFSNLAPLDPGLTSSTAAGHTREGRFKAATGQSTRPSPEQKDPVGATAAAAAGMNMRDDVGNCSVLYFIDGVPFEPLSNGRISNEIPPHHIHGVEIYTRASSVPGEYRRPGYECGVILIWTREAPR